MDEIVLREPLSSQIRQEATAQGIDVESLLEAALRHYRFYAQREKIEKEIEWWKAQPEKVRRRYAGEHVAVHKREVVDHDQDEDRLRQRIRIRYGKAPVLLTPADGQRELRIVSTRLAK